MGVYATCPYFRAERKLSITCEDTIRQYPSKAEKRHTYYRYCCSGWMGCPHAQALNAVYAIEDDKEREDRYMDTIINAKMHEINTLSTQNAILRKKVDELKGKISDMEKTAAANHEMYRSSLKMKSNLLTAKEAQIDWLTSFSGALMAKAYPGAEEIKLSKDDVYKMMTSHDLKLDFNDELGEWTFRISKKG